MDNVDPDDSFSDIPYEKGYAFLCYLEKLVGGPSVFEPFLQTHVQRFQYGMVDIKEWKNFFLAYFKDNKAVDHIDWEAWIYGTGWPPHICEINNTHVLTPRVAAEEYYAYGCLKNLNFDGAWTSDQKVVFLEKLLDLIDSGSHLHSFTAQVMQELDSRNNFSKSMNSEIRFRWYLLGIKIENENVFDDARQFLLEQGRMNFVRPLYRALFNCGNKGKKMALDTFKSNSVNMHAICRKRVAKDLSL
mmetsp:Transcript_21299/g.27214  ORF Transcript_21299/g.27214 Transcript_21299/m.27214 type:complete len:245 (+) Transcript_21299:2-736(+)